MLLESPVNLSQSALARQTGRVGQSRQSGQIIQAVQTKTDSRIQTRLGSQFVVGQTVVYPHHGPATISSISNRVVGRSAIPVECLDLDVHCSKLHISVPSTRAVELGMRTVLSPEQLGELFDVLRGPAGPEQSSWTRRFKEFNELLKSPNILVVAGVVRNLSRRLERTHLSVGEKDMLKQARLPLIEEIRLSLSVSSDEATTILDSVIAQGEVDQQPEVELAAA
jgi:CarD family transcriptional regulator